MENFSWHNFFIFLAAAVLKLHQDKTLNIISDGIVYTSLRTILMKCLIWKTKLEFVRQAVRCWRKSCNINSLFVVENACRSIKTRAGWRTAERTQWDEWLVCYNIAARGGNAVFGVVMDRDCRKTSWRPACRESARACVRDRCCGLVASFGVNTTCHLDGSHQSSISLRSRSSVRLTKDHQYLYWWALV